MLLTILLLLSFWSKAEARKNSTLTAVSGIKVGIYSEPGQHRGVTVIRFEGPGAVAAVDVRGGGPGTRETDALKPENLIERVHGIVLAGGSAWGLNSASGVMKCLEEAGVGYDTGEGILVPIVPTAVIYDLRLGNSSVRPSHDWGYRACKSASKHPVLSGNHGAGAGATVGKFFGMGAAMKSGQGSSLISVPGKGKVAALVIVNALGDIKNPETGHIIAGARNTTDGSFIDTEKTMLSLDMSPKISGTNTIIAVIATDIPMDKSGLQKLAQMAQDGIGRTTFPAHTMFDGDTVFAVSTATNAPPEKNPVTMTIIGTAAAKALAQAILNGVVNARPVPGYPAAGKPPGL